MTGRRVGGNGGGGRPSACRGALPNVRRWGRRAVPAVRLAALGGLALLAAPHPGAAQDDVRALGARYGVTPPAGYFRMLESRPDAYRFRRAWQGRNPRLEVDADGVRRILPDPVTTRQAGEVGTGGAGGAAFPASGPGSAGGAADPGLRMESGGGTAAFLGPRPGGVTGTLAFPVLLGYFADAVGPPAYDRGSVQDHFLDGPNPRGGSLREFFLEVSLGRLDFTGEALGWYRSAFEGAQVAGTSNGLSVADSRTGPYIADLLEQADDGSIDWGRFDNDGPDGIPNSGDDDGFVDVLAVLHPRGGAECNGDTGRIWSHRWRLSAWLGRPFETGSPAAGGGVIRVDDYTIQPLLDCQETGIGDIGVFAHELGHGLGLPDLYCTGFGCDLTVVGNWGLMSSGGWGCAGENPARPCHMSAWAKSILGWVDVVELTPETEYGTVSLPGVRETGQVLRYDLPGTNQYYLLENRQRAGFDQDLYAPGLLIWSVDDDVVLERWATNRVNASGTSPGFGVALIQADGRRDMERFAANRGDGGDPFPGSTDRRDFHAGTVPGSFTRAGAAAAFTLTGLREAGAELAFELTTRTGHATVVTRGGSGATGLVSVNGTLLGPVRDSTRLAPFQPLTLEAAPGEVLEAGVRTPFTGWDDGPVARSRTLTMPAGDTTFTAVYDGRELQVAVALEGGRFGVAPGRVEVDPASEELWFPQGTSVTLTAEENPGFRFARWTGALEGAPNPVGLTVETPVSAGAAFDYVFSVAAPETVTLAAGDMVELAVTVENAQLPLTWSRVDGTLPDGVVVNGAGLFGAPLETGTFDVTLGVRDAQGLQGSVAVTLEVGVPDLPLSVLAGPFLAGAGGPTAPQALWLDRTGNGNGAFDLGDVRAYQQAVAAGEALTAPAAGTVRVVVPSLRLGPPGGRP